MAEPLKNMFGPDVVHRTAASFLRVAGDFDVDTFTTIALDGFEDLELTLRCRQIASAMAAALPADRDRAIEVVIESLGPELENCDPDDAAPTGDVEIDDNPMAGFFYVPHSFFVADQVDADFDLVMRANYEITKRSTAEFSIRTPLRDLPTRTLAVLAEWTHDDNVHVRRLVSEGSRPRLPWAPRLRAFQDDPSPVVELLEELKDDPVEYVRRSVANNLNDISKDHPDVAVEVARRWWSSGAADRRRLVRHGLRTLVKAGDADALAVLGFGSDSPARLAGWTIAPRLAQIGGKVVIELTIENPSPEPCAALVDLRVHFVKASGSTSPKVFKGAELHLDGGESATVRKSVSVAQHSTRTHHAGVHRVEALVNGSAVPVGEFDLLDPAAD